MRKKSLILTLIFILSCFISSVNAATLELPLNRFAYSKTITIRCISGAFTMQIPIPERWEVKKAILSVPYVNSSNLLLDRAQIVIKINELPIGQVRLNPLLPEGKISLAIPPNSLPSGYNRLTFQVAQHYSKDCENPCAPDLWTSLNFGDAFLHLEYEPRPVPLKLSELGNFLFDDKTFPQGEVNIITDKASSDIITLAGVAASGIARRFNYKKVVFSASRDLKPGYDNVLIGTKEFVEGFLQQRGMSAGHITGPFLKVMHMPSATAGYASFSAKAAAFLKQKGLELNEKLKRFLNIPVISSGKVEADPFHALVVVTGVNLKQVEIAAETLANMTFPFPGIDETTILEFNMPDISQYSGRRVLQSDKLYKFKTLEFGTHTFEGLQPSPMELAFRLPADFLIKQNQTVKMTLNFAYGAGMRPDSVLNIQLNGKQVRAISVGKATGDTITGYRIDLPTYLFRPGSNVIAFVPILTPIAKECDLIQIDSLFLTIFENSTFFFPPMGHFVELPRIELFMLNGFPFTRWPDGYETLMYLTHGDENTLSAAFNLIGLITQKNGYPLFGIKMALEKPQNWQGELIVLGEVNSVPDALKQNAPLKILKESSVTYPVMIGWEGEESFAISKQKTELGTGSGAIMEFQSPYMKGRSVLLLTASSSKDLLSFSEALLNPGVQASSEGDLVMVRLTEPDYKVSALASGPKYFTGKIGKISTIGMYLYTYPFLYYAAILLVISVAGLIMTFFLRRYRKRRKQAGTTEEASKDKLSLSWLLGFILRKSPAGGDKAVQAKDEGRKETETKIGNRVTRFFKFILRLIKK